MSDTLNRKLTTYPRPNIVNKIKAQAEKQGITVSKVIQEALDDYYKKPNK
jgi:Ribbon-helix-helix domain